jgi:hypothetical protein
MPDDKGDDFSGRTYLVMRYGASDIGARPLPTGEVPWASPDITIVKPDGTQGAEAVAGQTNTVAVTVQNFGGVDAIGVYVDAFVCSPTTGFTPATGFSVGGDFIDVPGYSNATVPLPWTPDPTFIGHCCILARANLTIPPDTYLDGSVFDIWGDRHVAQHNIFVVDLAGRSSVTFPFLIPNLTLREGEFSITARELREKNEIAVVARALGTRFLQVGETAMPAVQLAPIQPLGREKLEDDVIIASGATNRMWFDPKKLEPTSRPSSALKLTMKPNDVVPAVAIIERNSKTRAGDVHAVAIRHVDAKDKLIGGLTIVVRH